MKLGLIAVGIVAIAAVVGVVIVFVASSSTAPPSESQRAKNVAWKPGSPPPEADMILKWLAENSNDPKSVEVVAWENRIVRPADAKDGGSVSVILKYRSRNGVGAITIKREEFYLWRGTITCMPID